MKSQIDWNEIVPRLGAGLQQTLYLEAVKLITNREEHKRDYAREYYRRSKSPAFKARRIKSRRLWTDAMKRRVVAMYGAEGYTATCSKHRISGSMLNRWLKEFPAKKQDGQAHEKHA